MKNQNEIFGDIIRKRRKQLRMTQEDLVDIEISKKTLQKIEKGVAFPGYKIFIYLSAKLKLSTTEIIKQIIFYGKDKDYLHIDILAIHNATVDTALMEWLNENVESILLDVHVPYNNKLELLYLAIFFEISIDKQYLQKEVKYIMHKTQYTDIDAEILSALLKRNIDHSLTKLIVKNAETFLERKGNILAIIYGICIQYYRTNEWDSIINLCTKYIERKDIFYNDFKYLAHIYAQRAVAKFNQNHNYDDDAESAFQLCAFFHIDNLASFLREELKH